MKVNAPQVTERFVQVGTIRKSHGLSGEVLAAFAGRTSLRDLVGKPVWVTPPTQRVHCTAFERIDILADSDNGDAYVSLEGVKSLDDSSGLSRKRLICRREDVPISLLEEIEDEESGFALLGYSVHSEVYGDLGAVVEYIETKANDILVVEGCYGEVLLPVIDEVVLAIDDEQEHIKVFVLPGLIEKEPPCA